MVFYFLLKYSCIQYYMFQVYNIVILHLHILQCDHQDMLSNHLSPYKVIIILLAVFSSCVYYFIAGSLYLLFPFTFFTHIPMALLWQP